MKTYIVLTALVTSVFFNITSVLVMLVNLHHIDRLEKENAILQDDLNTYKESSIYWKEKCEHYQSANEALIKYSEPEAINKAAKATPLPKLVMKG